LTRRQFKCAADFIRVRIELDSNADQSNLIKMRPLTLRAPMPRVFARCAGAGINCDADVDLEKVGGDMRPRGRREAA
jgi:hypothetical protein